MAYGGVVYFYVFLNTFLLLLVPSLSYFEYTLENQKVCSLTRKRELKMGEREYSGIIVKELKYFDRWSGSNPFNCTFTVLATWPYGIIAVIQNVVLRQNESTKECIDYVQFQRHEKKHLFQQSKVIRSQKYCGKVNIFQDPNEFTEPDDQLSLPAHNAFIDPKGRLDVTISVASQRLLPTESLDISIAFTGFVSCKELSRIDGFKQCQLGGDMCIWEGFFNDRIVNCPFNDCLDESGCPLMSPGGKRTGSGLGTKVTIGAVVAILALLLLFLLCLFVCRHCQVLCWSGTAPRHSSAQPSNRVEMTSHAASTRDDSELQQPSAPPLLSSSSPTSPVHEDKDLPPPYESLFPSR